ncbi:serine/threonine protein kinase [Nodosilinea sp. LEGE 07298]|jgi:serine/threonine-protein kinase|uniref:serine/threonine-protein kinase n=1 Tax=Nodosilinea sp. LEGE 07298 TaxID=2777970 RepID=UPI00187E30D2|nr:serine/threonine-protein kinase [Nodosilinea sp. LEGE 07298]MBE9107881.1 serine/threonine protein kinase [Nodosilinea sp. LEGE 07298]
MANPPGQSLDRTANSEIRHYYQSHRLFRDRYRVLKKLGQGGFGVTYLAQNATLPGEPYCVIKQLCPKAGSELSLERAKVRFRREARALANLGSHSQIPQLLDYFTTEGEFYLVQDYIHGETLAQEVRRQGRLTEAQVKYFLREIIPVVRFIHRNRIIHRDIKPPNIIRSERERRLVLIDFGAVREFLSDVEDQASLQAPATQFVGTPGFAPPEQLALRPCYASDIYALGITSLYLLTARTPIEFDQDPNTGAIRWHHTVNVSPHMTTVLDKMLMPDARDRYTTIDQLERALELEPHLEALAGCMNTRDRPPYAPDGDQVELNPDAYLTPIQREAQAIRKWRTKRSLSRGQQGRPAGPVSRP